DADLGLELARGADVLAAGIDVDAVRALGHREEVDDARVVLRIEHRRAADGPGAAGIDRLLRRAPVHRGAVVHLVLRGLDLARGVRLLAVVAGEDLQPWLGPLPASARSQSNGGIRISKPSDMWPLLGSTFTPATTPRKSLP